jgi:rSAM/selenodomain-associated transferase 2
MKLSVIIPVLNEEGQIGKLLSYLNNSALPDGAEILVIDGGSTDNTPGEVRESGVRFVTSAKGRAVQMNRGAQEAGGEVLFFLHADSIPPPGFADLIIDAVRSGKSAGCFRLAFDEPRLVMRLYGWFTRFNLLPFRFGDQGLFVTRELFEKSGGFREDHRVMEDNEIVRRLRKITNFTVLESEVLTSARKYRENGFVRLQLIFVTIFVLYYCGASQDLLVRFYRDMIRG